MDNGLVPDAMKRPRVTATLALVTAGWCDGFAHLPFVSLPRSCTPVLFVSPEDQAENAEEIAGAYSFDAAREAERMQMAWNIREVAAECEVTGDGIFVQTGGCGQSCRDCSGKGCKSCRFCHGTGFFTIGEELIGQGNPCPACRSLGEEKCRTCVGTGKIAKWDPPKSHAQGPF